MDLSNEYLKQLEQIRHDISQLSIDDEFKKLVLGDMDLAVNYFHRENILGILNVLTVAALKFHTYLFTATESCEKIEPILRGIHWIQQFLILKPINVVGPTGATGATGASGCVGPIGYIGATGASGCIGPMGCTGATGASGCIGPMGHTGPVGPSGANGTTTFVTTSIVPIIPDREPEQQQRYTYVCRADRHH